MKINNIWLFQDAPSVALYIWANEILVCDEKLPIPIDTIIARDVPVANPKSDAFGHDMLYCIHCHSTDTEHDVCCHWFDPS